MIRATRDRGGQRPRRVPAAAPGEQRDRHRSDDAVRHGLARNSPPRPRGTRRSLPPKAVRSGRGGGRSAEPAFDGDELTAAGRRIARAIETGVYADRWSRSGTPVRFAIASPSSSGDRSRFRPARTTLSSGTTDGSGLPGPRSLDCISGTDGSRGVMCQITHISAGGPYESVSTAETIPAGTNGGETNEDGRSA